MQFTKDQRAAIDHEGSALLVSAAAGSGKTAVLVERAARLLVRDKDPVPADKLLIVTFTRAAAASLRAKLAARLAEEQLKHPGSAWLRRQRMLLQRASIGTIDSFCCSWCRPTSASWTSRRIFHRRRAAAGPPAGRGAGRRAGKRLHRPGLLRLCRPVRQGPQ